MTRLKRNTSPIRTALVAAAVALPLSLAAVRAAGSSGALKAVQGIAIQHNGRYKPFESFARETLATITGASQGWHAFAASAGGAEGRDEAAAIVLSIMAEPERWQQALLVAVPFVPLREPLGMDRKATHISYGELTATRKLMRMLPPIVQKQQRNDKLTMLENETMDLFRRFVELNALLEHKLDLVPPSAGTGPWRPILEPEGYPPAQRQAFREAWEAMLIAVRRGDAQALEASGFRLAEQLERANPAAYPPGWRRQLELLYNRLQPFNLARLLYALACVLLLVNLKRPGIAGPADGILLAAGVGLHAAGIGMRVVLGGRPPVSNFFETMLWLPLVGVVVALVLYRIYRSRYITLAAALLATITLTLKNYVPLDPSIAPVVAVLRSNLWLTIHVLTIVASYGALGLATVVAHVYGWLHFARTGRHPALPLLDVLLYRTIQVGVVLLAGGIMLGAVWANASWGRYWGWDPKETWALITLLWFLAVLHGRFAGWIRGVGVALATIGGFFLLLMTYYGVSFYLVGLHSYAGGHAKPLPALLIGYLVAEAVFLAVVGLRPLAKRRAG